MPQGEIQILLLTDTQRSCISLFCVTPAYDRHRCTWACRPLPTSATTRTLVFPSVHGGQSGCAAGSRGRAPRRTLRRGSVWKHHAQSRVRHMRVRANIQKVGIRPSSFENHQALRQSALRLRKELIYPSHLVVLNAWARPCQRIKHTDSTRTRHERLQNLETRVRWRGLRSEFCCVRGEKTSGRRAGVWCMCRSVCVPWEMRCEGRWYSHTFAFIPRMQLCPDVCER